METESVKSERSSRSHRSRNSNVRNSRNSHRSNHSTKSKPREMAPFQTSVNLTTEDSRDGHQEVIEVQILPQDENWGTETHITGNTSEQSISMEDVSNWNSGGNGGGNFACQKHMERVISLMLCMAAFCSPIAMALLPKLGFFPSTFQNEELNQLTKMQLLACNAECKGEIIVENRGNELFTLLRWRKKILNLRSFGI
jgi:vang-like